MIVDEEVYLAHYGVLGMKWGVRKDRDALRKERRERNAQKYLKKAKVFQTRIDQLNRSSSVSPYSKTWELTELHSKKRQALRDAEAKRQGKLSENQKTMLKGAAVVGGILAAAGAYHLAQSGEGRRLIEKGKDFFKDKHDPGWKLDRSLADPNLTPDVIMTDVVSKINPGYGNPGTKVNCRRATFAYEMRRRGYDVMATKTTNGYGQNVVGNHNILTPGEDLPTGRFGIARKMLTEKFRFMKDYEAETPVTTMLTSGKLMGEKSLSPTGIFHDLAKLPNGARGELGMQWRVGGGHSMAFEIIKGKPVIFDTQSGIKYTSQAAFKEMADAMHDAAYTRLDDKTLDTNYIMRWVKNV